MTHNRPPASANLYQNPSVPNGELRTALQLPSTVIYDWKGEIYGPDGTTYWGNGGSGLSAKITEPGTHIDMSASYLCYKHTPTVKRPMIITTTSPSAGRQKWGFDGQVLVPLPPQNPKTHRFPPLTYPASGAAGVSIVTPEFLRRVQASHLPGEVTIGALFGRSEHRTVASVTVDGDVLSAFGLTGTGPDSLLPRAQELKLLNPLRDVETIVNEVRVQLGLPSGEWQYPVQSRSPMLDVMRHMVEPN